MLLRQVLLKARQIGGEPHFVTNGTYIVTLFKSRVRVTKTKLRRFSFTGMGIREGQFKKKCGKERRVITSYIGEHFVLYNMDL